MRNNELIERIRLCNRIIESEKKRKHKCHNGRVKASLVHNKGNDVYQYYVRDISSDPTGRYLKKGEVDIARRLAQEEYSEKVLKAAEKEKCLIEAFLKKHDDLVFNAYSDMPEGKRILVEPYVLTDDEFARRWQEKKYTGGKFEEDDPAYYTKRGDRVRSKSEQIIADRLFDAGVPYRYEFPFVYDSFEGKKQIFTDFTALNKRTRTVYRWEHFGRMDDPKYRKTFFWKQFIYSQNNCIPGVGIIFTFEDNENPLDTRYVDRIIETYFK